MEFEKLKDYIHLFYLCCLALAYVAVFGSFYLAWYVGYRLIKAIKREQTEDFTKWVELKVRPEDKPMKSQVVQNV